MQRISKKVIDQNFRQNANASTVILDMDYIMFVQFVKQNKRYVS